MNEDFFVNRKENILRRENNIYFQKYLDLKYTSSINYNKEFTNQKIKTSISPLIPEFKYGAIFTELSFKLDQKYPRKKDITNFSYPISWKESLIDSYSPGEEDAVKRNSELKFIFNLFTNPENDAENKKAVFLGLNINANTRINFEQDKLKQSKETTSFSISAPFKVDNIFMTPLFTRKIERNKADSELALQNSYKQDLNSLFTGLKTQYWIFSKPIFYDLFDKNINKQMQLNDLNSYYFYNVYSFSLSRLLKTSLIDLFLPLEFTTAISRQTKSEKTYIKASDIYSLEFLIKYLTINISGKYGLVNWSKWYEQDELNRLYKFNFDFGKNFFKFNLNAEHKLNFFLNYTNKLEFKNKFSCKASKLNSSKIKLNSWSEEFSFSYIASANKTLPSLIINKFSKINIKDFREEKASIKLYTNEESKKINYLISFSHSQISKIGKNGEIKLFVDLEGKSTENKSFLFGMGFGISGKIEY